LGNDTKEPRRGPSDADSSSTKPPATQEPGEEVHLSDPRLHPGGAHGSAVDPGMSSLHEEDLPDDPHHMR
jgi:hypothetical protein